MKKTIKIAIFTLVLTIFSCNYAMASDWSIDVNGEKLDVDVKIIDGRSLVPLRAVGEALGLKVDYNGSIVTMSAGRLLREPIYLGNLDVTDTFDTMYIDTTTGRYGADIDEGSDDHERLANGQYSFQTHNADSFLYVPPVNIDSRLYVPVRIICDSFGAPVTVTDNVISIGSCFTAEGKSVDKVKQLIYTPGSNEVAITDVNVSKSVQGATSEPTKNETKLNAPTISVSHSFVATLKTLKASWSTVSGAKGYQLYIKEGDNGSWTEIKTFDSSVNSYESVYYAGAYYYFKVRAYGVDSQGNTIYSDFSNIEGLMQPAQSTNTGSSNHRYKIKGTIRIR